MLAISLMIKTKKIKKEMGGWSEEKQRVKTTKQHTPIHHPTAIYASSLFSPPV